MKGKFTIEDREITLRIIPIGLLAFASVLSGCAANKVKAIAEESDNSQINPIDSLQNYRPLQSGEIPKLHYDGPIFFAPPPEIDAKPIPLPVWIDDSTAEATIAPVRSAEGYRIQIYAGRDKLPAKRIEEDARNRTGLSVYLIYEAPQYKVRVGNFVDRDQAVQDCDRLKQIGFSEAWVVRTTIMVQK